MRLREVRPKEDAVRWHSLLAADGAGPHSGADIETIERRFEGFRGRFYDRNYVIHWAVALKADDLMVGNVRYWEYQGHPEAPWQFGSVQFDLAKPFFSADLGAEALRAAAEFGISKLGLARVQWSDLAADTSKWDAVLAAGFQKEGVLRDWWFDEGSQQWTDEMMFSFVARDARQAQP